MAQVGRPRSFDRTQAIDDALLLFWRYGYEATSLSRLKAAIGGGITAPSFYAAFGSKEALFKEVVARYMETHGRVNDPLFDETLAPREAIASALSRSARMQCDERLPKGCLVALGTLGSYAEEDSSLSLPLREARARIRAGLLACVRRGIVGGDLAQGTDAQALATLFEGFLLGISPMARDGVALPVIEGAIAMAMTLWDGQRPPGRGVA
ncbi:MULTISPECIES: TetR/AcrR family transcriptional regulator [unclassified Pseudomonas]|uniref:TetR/AcrR family transcriptional regulator n=1 Tax=unclassified Pseudomonas TaxID=196821 RepID=UPI002360BBA7|nr:MULTISPECIES: TetR/AcrR family transcriptional regulator [unclassified Pseudomonas]MDR6178720.1 AcrR family transcriptional regulator [Pseudomonas sp. SORGH_AS_0211]